MPEPGVEEMEGGVLHAAVVPIHLAPVAQRLLGGQGLVIVGVHVPQEVPGRPSPLGHGVGLPLGRAAAAGAGGVHPVGHGRQGGLPVVGGLIAAHLGQQQGELLLRQRNPAALVAVDQGDGLPPIPLAGEDPVPELVVDLGSWPMPFSSSHFFMHWNGFLHRQAVEEVGVHHDPGVVLQGKGRLLACPRPGPLQ